jgi:DNA-binding LacI/PurR family transcriptional regulator
MGLAHELVHTEFDEESGAEAARRLLSSSPRPTAIFTCTARQGLGVLSAAWNAGLSVPGDLSLVAYADVRLLRYIVPPVTAVEAPLVELGAAAVDALLDQIASGNVRDVVVDAHPRLVVRSSTTRALDD